MIPRAFRGAMPALRWLNAALLVLAACRALVPGLCATQLAMQESADVRGAAAHALPACCAAEAPYAPGGDGAPSWLPAVPPHAACGFCALMQGMLDPLTHALFPAPTLAIAEQFAPEFPVPSLRPMRSHLGRAPPRPECVCA